MKNKKLPFEIGEQYELNEFNLEYIETKLIGEYEYQVYRYIKNDKPVILGFKIKEIRLYYNADILERVKYYLSNTENCVVITITGV